MSAVVDLLEYHDLVASRHTLAIPLVRRAPPRQPPARVKPAPVVRMIQGTVVTVRTRPATTVGVYREGVTFWRAPSWS
jgi:hypothetical protein